MPSPRARQRAPAPDRQRFIGGILRLIEAQLPADSDVRFDLDCLERRVALRTGDRMVELGMLSTPGIAIDGRLVHQGSIPKAADVQRLLGLK